MRPEKDVPLDCWLCERGMGKHVQWHHTIPKSKKGPDGKKGRRTVPIHPICHRAIHANWPNAELARFGEDRAFLLANEKLANFVSWIAKKPVDFNGRYRR
jgi:hypothetical protein